MENSNPQSENDGGTSRRDYPSEMSNIISMTAPTEPLSAIKSMSDLRIGEITPSAFNPGLSPIGTARGTDKFLFNQQDLLKIYEKRNIQNKEKRSYSKSEARKSGNRMYQAYLKQQAHLAQLKQQREEEIKSTIKQKPTICKKSIRLHKQLN